MDLPERYSDLVKKASTFQCPQRAGGGEYGDDGQAAMLCLICGKMLCTNSYCCQKVVEVEGEERSEEEKLRIGGFTQHAQRFASARVCVCVCVCGGGEWRVKASREWGGVGLKYCCRAISSRLESTSIMNYDYL